MQWFTHVRQYLSRQAAIIRFPKISSILVRQRGYNPVDADSTPLRAEIFSIDQLERLARSLATSHRLAQGRPPNVLLPRLDDNEKVLVNTYHTLTAAIMLGRQVSPAAEWLLDNFYLIEDNIRMARRHLPRAYYSKLPWLVDGKISKFPRVYGIVMELIAHVDGQIDSPSVDSFINAYQAIKPLKIGELWAVPIMLRLALIENLRRVASRVATACYEQAMAIKWFEQMIHAFEKNPTDLILVVADLVRENPPLTGAFLAELTRNIHGQSRHFSLAMSWLEQRLLDQGTTLEALVAIEGQMSATDQVSIGNSINSLRFLSACDWKVFVERHSVIEQVLRKDPAQVYGCMDFTTRDRYRHVVEELAVSSSLAEDDVARRALQLAQNAAENRPDDRAAHIGYYLIDHGRATLEQVVRMRFSCSHMAASIVRRYPLVFYLFGMLAITLIVTASVIIPLVHHGVGLLWLVGSFTLVLASRVGSAFVNWLVGLLASPQPLPRLDFRAGIPDQQRTIVVVPTILSGPAAVQDILDGLKMRYLVNRDPNLCFALLTDFEDAQLEVMPGDEEILAIAVHGIEALNKAYRRQRHDIFLLFHRARQWNAQQNIWMGYERKRGKIAQFNELLRNLDQAVLASSKFSKIVGSLSVLADIKYVITLDTDTKLPYEAAHKMVGSMAHILNRPVLDQKLCRLVDGYSILQPRIGVTLPSYQRSWFTRLSVDNPGVDPYTHLVSDVYQDLFGEGSFIGKGIYDLTAFTLQCNNFPENAILSHDLLESAYARSGLLSDVELYEEYPASYLADASRRQRWIRGDWQLLWWLLPFVPNRAGKFVRNPITALSWWKIFDNFRRSLESIAMLMLLILSWLFLSCADALAISFFVVGTLAVAPLLGVLTGVVRKLPETPLVKHMHLTAAALDKEVWRLLFAMVCLPFEAYLCTDAIVRTMVRVLLTKKNLLEWRSSFRTQQESRHGLWFFLRSMWLSPILAIILILVLCFGHYPVALWSIAGPMLGLWLIAPAIAFGLSRPIVPRVFHPSVLQMRFLGKIARRTLRFFELFVTEKDNWLPPDNVQENPAITVASRTSPTNIGIGLLSNLAAYDFGYLAVGRFLERTQHSLNSVSRLERYHGHFLNWYDTQSLKPLAPRYVSTVDSGNLVGHLLTLRSGLLELIESSILPPRMFEGMRDTVHVMLEVAAGFGNTLEDVPTAEVSAELIRRIQQFDYELQATPHTLSATVTLLRSLRKKPAELFTDFAIGTELRWWLTTFERMCSDYEDDLLHLAGWVGVPAAPDMVWLHGSPEHRKLLEQFKDIFSQREILPSLPQAAAFGGQVGSMVEEILHSLVNQTSEKRDKISLFADWFAKLRDAALQSAGCAERRKNALAFLAHRCHELVQADFSILYSPSRSLFTIGYNIDTNRFDDGYYDLLASEARVASYVAIAQGQLGQDHWFALSRMLAATDGLPVLLSWSGSVFEYLMPLLVMPTCAYTLLDQTYRSVVAQQIKYGKQKNVPWGISESGFNLVDVHLNYQYRAFGVPGLGLKRGLGDDLVIAPYASALALMVEPAAACQNLERLAADGRVGSLGFYEAIDYTPSRLPRGVSSVTVRQFMAHHQGMALLAIANFLLERPMQRRFMADPLMRAAELLLHERIPKISVTVSPHVEKETRLQAATKEGETTIRVLTAPNDAPPEVQLLSNGRYLVVVTSAGGGYSRWRDLAITRWREDPTRDSWGSFCYIRDLDSGAFWSTTWQPTLKRSKTYEAVFSKGRADFKRSDEDIDTHTEMVVSPEDDIELRRISLTNRSLAMRVIELTSYAEMVLAPQNNDLTHPAFGNLFIQIEQVKSLGAILCTRRARSAEEVHPWVIHLMSVKGKTLGTVSFETDRAKFIGRGRSLATPAAMDPGSVLSDSQQSVLDPVAAIRKVIQLEPGETVMVDVVIGVAETKQQAMTLAERYHDPRLTSRVFELAWTHSQISLRQLGATEADARIFCRLVGSVLYSSPLFRAETEILAQNHRGQSGLWGYGISGDLPIVLVRIRDHSNIELVSQLINAHGYWRMKGIKVDLIIWNEDDSTYRQILQEAIINLIATSPEASLVDKPGGIFLRRGDQMSPEDRLLMQSVARVVLRDDRGLLSEQVERFAAFEVPVPIFRPLRWRKDSFETVQITHGDLMFFNGFGGFSADGREYVMILAPSITTPAPWVNVIANSQFGTVVSESGSVYTWSQNSHEFRLTPWSNDTVTDVSGEAFYIRDEYSGHFWSPSPLPCRGSATYLIRHGFGYTTFEYYQEGIASELTIFVPMDAPVKIARLRITNRSSRRRQLSITGYFELVLGEFRDKTLTHVTNQLDTISGAIFSRNTYNAEFADMIAFATCNEGGRTITTDRTEFIGRNGNMANPLAMHRVRLSGKVQPGNDPCAAMQVAVGLDSAEYQEIIFILGTAQGEKRARDLIERFCSSAGAQIALDDTMNYWQQVTSVLQVETPDPSINFLMGGWLLYQVLSSRIWARTGFYQSSGAFGFRDQLQDTMAMVYAEPQILRQHLLRAAARQFIEGDVQHWWHPPAGHGVRTHCSDDFLWLPYATCHYLTTTGDSSILEEQVPFLSGRAIRPEEEGYYDLPRITDETGTLYEHCIRAIDHGLCFGVHGLPLMGSGDWNDGMNHVGVHGKGESVWLAFFCCDVLNKFAALARQRGDISLADKYTVELGRLRGHIEESTWDGAWYLRAFFDDGQPLGSSSNTECQIDSIPQSWSVLSGAAIIDRTRLAMASAEKRLVRHDAKLIKLFDPPFEKSAQSPGYIKGYMPGVRENGGQYTHGAIWMIMAFAKMGDTQKAFELFSLINPIHHADTPQSALLYRVEPYVVAADVYACEPYMGRGGWTWYTGSAAWMYRLLIESILGVSLTGDKLAITPCIPRAWPSYKIKYRYQRDTSYEITVHGGGPENIVGKLVVDGDETPHTYLQLVDDHAVHVVDVYLR